MNDASATPACHPVRFDWQGDLADDCTCRVGILLAHCECMGAIRWEDVDPTAQEIPIKSETWHVSVSIVDNDGREQVSLFHSGESGGLILGSEMARAIAESILRVAAGSVLRLTGFRP